MKKKMKNKGKKRTKTQKLFSSLFLLLL